MSEYKEYGPIQYIVSYIYAPSNAEYILRKTSDGTALLQRHSEGIYEDVYKCKWNESNNETFKNMLIDVRKHMPPGRRLYVERSNIVF